MNLQELDRQLSTLTVFEQVGQDAVFGAFHRMLHQLDQADCAAAASDFVSKLYQRFTDNWTVYLRELVFTLETPGAHFASVGKPMPACIEASARHDLRVLSEAAEVTAELVSYCMNAEGVYIPAWVSEPTDLETLYFERLAEIGKHGFGMFAKHKMFHMERSEENRSGFVLEPVRYPDPVQIADLIGYEMQRGQIIDNVRALVSGKKAANVLLYGDAGTGKSASVKAIANSFAGEGLRLIELSKNELHLLPRLLEQLSGNPLKFLLFIDDLSFQDNDDDFSALKAVLEGSISERSHNTAIFATSNRRHIVRETFSQRVGDEVHRTDSMQETISLSERFGITVYFEKPNKELYLRIVDCLADQYGITMDRQALALEAERFAMRKSGRSARAARQLIEQIAARESLNLS